MARGSPPYFGLCSVEDCGAAEAKELVSRIDSSLTPSEREFAKEIEHKKYLAIIHKYGIYHAIRIVIFVVLAAAFFAILGKRRNIFP
jgi:hypothetical protein